MRQTITLREVLFDIRNRIQEYDMREVNDLEILEAFHQGQIATLSRLPPDALPHLITRARYPLSGAVGQQSNFSIDTTTFPEILYILYVVDQTGMAPTAAGPAEGPPTMVKIVQPFDRWIISEYASLTALQTGGKKAGKASPIFVVREQHAAVVPDGNNGTNEYRCDIMYVRGLSRTSMFDLTAVNEIGDEWLDLAIHFTLIQILRPRIPTIPHFEAVIEELQATIEQMLAYAHRNYVGALRLTRTTTPSDARGTPPAPGTTTYTATGKQMEG